VLPPDVQFKAFLDQGTFKLQRSLSSSRFFFYPRVAEPRHGIHRFRMGGSLGSGDGLFGDRRTAEASGTSTARRESNWVRLRLQRGNGRG
jgi:hypothetical protein